MDEIGRIHGIEGCLTQSTRYKRMGQLFVQQEKVQAILFDRHHRLVGAQKEQKYSLGSHVAHVEMSKVGFGVCQPRYHDSIGLVVHYVIEGKEILARISSHQIIEESVVDLFGVFKAKKAVLSHHARLVLFAIVVKQNFEIESPHSILVEICLVAIDHLLNGSLMKEFCCNIVKRFQLVGHFVDINVGTVSIEETVVCGRVQERTRTALVTMASRDPFVPICTMSIDNEGFRIGLRRQTRLVTRNRHDVFTVIQFIGLKVYTSTRCPFITVVSSTTTQNPLR
mmetsp:Transcript_19583/g.48767  ORF Transcript_19583/g.48767 Transcript_19583/m.48767 type:complete len:282 (+) Transcript_19583:392-1237(+)